MPDDTSAPVSAEGLRERIAEALAPWCRVHEITEAPCERCELRLNAVLAALAGDPGDLPARMAEAILDLPGTLFSDTHRDHLGGFAAGCPVCKADVPAIAAAALSVRWEAAVQQAAEVERLRAELADYREALSQAQVMAADYAVKAIENGKRADKAEAELAEVKRQFSAFRNEVLGDLSDVIRERNETRAERDALRAAIRAAMEIRQIHHRTDHAHRLLDPDCTVCRIGLVLNREMPARPDSREELTALARATEAEATLAWGREALEGAVAAWTTERDFYAERAGRKGYSHDEAAAEAYSAAIKAVTGILAALDAPETPGDAG